MTVQISVTVWTILCFLALMLILDRLLFRPLLSFMDERRSKVDGAREKKESALREREEELHRREEDQAAAEKRSAQELSAAVESAQKEAAQAAADKKADNVQRLEETRQKLEQESQDIQKQLSPRLGELAAVFAGRLQAWQDQESGEDDIDETAAPHAEIASVNPDVVENGAETI